MLTAEQERARTHLSGPMLVAAGPGSGKTRVVTERVKYLLKTTLPERILVITFTRKAAGEMRERFMQMTDAETASRVFFGTFHSFFYHCLETWHGTGWSHKASARFLCQGDEDEFYEFLQEKMAEEVEEHCLYNEYDYFMIDEFQDIDPLQYEIVLNMCSPKEKRSSANLFVVGDEDQSIYGFRGSDPSFFLHFQEDFPGAEIVFLTGNFRSGKVITEASDRLIHHNLDRMAKTIQAKDFSKRAQIQMNILEDKKMEAFWIAKKILQLRHKGNVYGSMAVLCRNGHEIGQIAKALKEAGIPYRTKSEWNASGSDYVDVRREMSSIWRCARFPEDKYLSKQVMKLFEIYSRYGNPDKVKEGPVLSQMMMQADIPMDVKEEQALMDDVFQKLRAVKRRREVYRRILWETDYLSFALKRLKQDGWGVFALARQVRSLFIRPKDGVHLMTVHASKGLEFETVFVSGLVEEQFPDLRSRIEEERRLFYVAITRAKTNLVLTAHQGTGKEPSRFLKELYENT